jgi:polysaccharide export outer membrane protein
MIARSAFAILASAAMLCSASVSLPAPASASVPIADAPPGPYRLGAGDEIRITVFGLDSATGTYVVGDGGTIAIPLLPPVMAAGKSADELQAAIVEALRARALLRDPSVSVQVQKYRPFFILGEVQRPGQYSYVPGMSVLTAVSIAGGYTFRANKKKAEIQRPVQGSLVKGDALPDTPVQPGDTINIKESWF